MKRVFSILAVLSMAVSTTTYAHPYDGYRQYGDRHGNNWVAPLLGGLVIGAILTDSRRPRYNEPRYSEPRPPYAPLVCRNIYIRDRYGNYVLDQDGRAIFTQRCWYQQDD